MRNRYETTHSRQERSPCAGEPCTVRRKRVFARFALQAPAQEQNGYHSATIEALRDEFNIARYRRRYRERRRCEAHWRSGHCCGANQHGWRVPS